MGVILDCAEWALKLYFTTNASDIYPRYLSSQPQYLVEISSLQEKMTKESSVVQTGWKLQAVLQQLITLMLRYF